MVPLDCRVATLLAMTSGGTGMGEVLRVSVFGRIPPALSLRARQGVAIHTLSVIARKVSKRTDVAIQSGTNRRRGEGPQGCPTRPLDCRVATLLAMTRVGTGMGGVDRFGWIAASGLCPSSQ